MKSPKNKSDIYIYIYYIYMHIQGYPQIIENT